MGFYPLLLAFGVGGPRDVARAKNRYNCLIDDVKELFQGCRWKCIYGGANLG